VAEHVLADPRQQIDRQQVHRIQQEDPDEHRERQRRDQLAARGVVHDALGLAVDHLDEDLDRGLESARHARGCLACGQPQQPAADHADDDREEGRIEIDDREVDDTALLLVLQVLQVVNDVLTRGWGFVRRAFSCHLVATPSCPNAGHATTARPS
jgi:hypothetical protein